ncbi:MAG: TolC family protein [Deltaproteobacteria bacterium]|nr:TolC family protein [Deltaproteobacteria bacterium]
MTSAPHLTLTVTLALLATSAAHAQSRGASAPAAGADSPSSPVSGAPRGTTGLSGLRPLDQPPLITLGEAFALAASSNIDLRVAAAQLAASKANLTKAWAVLLPNISLGANYTFNYPDQTAQFGDPAQYEQQALLFNSIADITEQSAAMNPDPLAQRAAVERAAELRKAADDIARTEPMDIVLAPPHVVEGNLTFAVPLFNGRALPLLQNAYGGVELTRLSVEQARAGVLWGTAQAYLQAVATTSMVSITDEQVASTTRHLGLAVQRHQQGLITELALERADLEVRKAEQQARQARAGLRAAKAALAGMIGRTDDFEVKAPPPVEALELGAKLDDLLARAWAQRLDLRVQKASLALAERSRAEAWMRLLPSFQLVAQGRYTSNTSGFSSQPLAGAVVVQGTLPIYDGGMTAGTIDEADIKVGAELLRVRQLEQTIERELRGTLDDLALKSDNVGTTAKLAELARKQATNAEDLYAQGVMTETDLRDARLGQFAADVDAARARLELETARLGLAYALGELPKAAHVEGATLAPLSDQERDAATASMDKVPE